VHVAHTSGVEGWLGPNKWQFGRTGGGAGWLFFKEGLQHCPHLLAFRFFRLHAAVWAAKTELGRMPFGFGFRTGELSMRIREHRLMGGVRECG